MDNFTVTSKKPRYDQLTDVRRHARLHLGANPEWPAVGFTVVWDDGEKQYMTFERHTVMPSGVTHQQLLEQWKEEVGA